MHDIADDRVRVFQTGQNCFGHLRAESVVSVETDATIGIGGLGGWLGDVVKHGGEAKGEWRIGLKHFQHDAGVDVNIAFRMPLRRLLAADERHDFRYEM